MSKFEFKIVAALLFASVTPLVVSAVLADRMVRDAFHVASTPNLLKHLEQSTQAYKMFFKTRKALYMSELERLARDEKLKNALETGDMETATKILYSFLERDSNVIKVNVVGDDGMVVASAERDHPESGLRTVELSMPMDGAAVKAVFGILERYIQDLEELEEDLQLTRDLEAARASIQKVFTWTFVGILGIVILGSAGIGIFLSRRVTKRINALVSATRRVAADDLDFVLLPRDTDEIGDLTREFNRMVQELKESRSRIQYLERISAWQGMARRLAHEIKNPLTPIQLAVEEVASKYDGSDPDFKRLLETALEVVHEEIDVLRSLVKEFSRFARIPAVKVEPTDLAAFMRDVAKSYSFDGSVNLELRVQEEPVVVALDKVMMRMVFENLVKNAVEAGQGNVDVWVDIYRSDSGAKVVIDVSDNGPGVPDEIKGRIFEPYFTSKNRGTGLGLAIVKKVVLDHGGVIEILDADQGGALFRITLPAVSAAKER